MICCRYFCETPTAAAKIIVDKKNSLLTELSELKHDMSFSLLNLLNSLKNEVTRLRHSLKSPLDRLQEKEQFLDELSASLNSSIKQAINLSFERLKSLARSLEALSPLSVLARGYSLSILEDTKAVIKEVSCLRPGDRVKTMLGKGFFLSRVEEIHEK